MMYCLASFLVGVLMGMSIQVYVNGIQYAKGVKEGIRHAFDIVGNSMAVKTMTADEFEDFLKEKNK